MNNGMITQEAVNRLDEGERLLVLSLLSKLGDLKSKEDSREYYRLKKQMEITLKPIFKEKKLVMIGSLITEKVEKISIK